MFGTNTERTGFMNKGKTGNWKDKLSQEMVKRFQEWEAKGLTGSDLKFVHEI